MSDPVLTRRALNRATLARQLLLERSTTSLTGALEHLVGLQAQTANTWYTGLWSRLQDFSPAELSRLLEEREVVRIALMRSTIHLVTTADALALRPLVQPAVERPMTGERRRLLQSGPAEEIARAGRALLAKEPLTNIELGKRLAGRWPGHSPSDLVMTVRVAVPLVQTPPRGLWGRSGAARHTPLDTWVGRPPGPTMPVETLVTRYLAAFGPATPADAQAWSGLTKLRGVFEQLRPALVVVRDEDGRELFDLPDAPRPGPETPAPPRFLYDFDNLLLSHADRSRFQSDTHAPRPLSEIRKYSYGTLLVDGFVHGIWRIERKNATATLVVRLKWPLSRSQEVQVAEEGASLLDFWAADADRRDVRFSRK